MSEENTPMHNPRVAYLEACLQTERCRTERAEADARSESARADRAEADARNERSRADRAEADARNERSRADRAEADARNERSRADCAEVEASSERARAERAEAEARNERARAESKTRIERARAERAEDEARSGRARAERADVWRHAAEEHAADAKARLVQAEDRVVHLLGQNHELADAIERLRQDFTSQRSADRTMVERNLRGLLRLHAKTGRELEDFKQKNRKTLQVSSNRILVTDGPLPCEHIRKINEDSAQEENNREMTKIYFNHAKSIASFYKKRRYPELFFKTDDAVISRVMADVKAGVTEKLEAFGVANPKIRFLRRTIKYAKDPIIDAIVFDVIAKTCFSIQKAATDELDLFTTVCYTILANPFEVIIDDIAEYQQYIA